MAESWNDDIDYLFDGSEFDDESAEEDFYLDDLLTPQEPVGALIENAKAVPHTLTKETNENCARILNHSELNASGLPGILRCYDSYNDGLRDHFHHFEHESTGMWLFKRDTSTPLRGVKLSSGLIAEWDPEFPLGLAVVVPSGEVNPVEGNTHVLKLHFGGRRNLLKNSNVIYLHSEKSRTDKRIKARCYFRIREQIPTTASGEPIFPALEVSECSSDGFEVLGTRSRSDDEGIGDARGGANKGGGGGGNPVARPELTGGVAIAGTQPNSRVQAAGGAAETSGTPVDEASEEMLRLLPVTQMRKLLQRHDEDAQQQILHFISNHVFQASKTPLSPDEDNPNGDHGNYADRRRKAEEEEVPSDMHRKSTRVKGDVGSFQALLEKSLDLIAHIEGNPSDEEAKLEFDAAKAEIETRRKVQNAGAEGVLPDHGAFEVVEVEPSEHVYGECVSEVRLDASILALHDDLAECILNSKRSSDDDNRDSIIIDAQSWEEFRTRMEIASVHIEGSTSDTTADQQKKTPKPKSKGGTLKDLIAFQDKLKKEMDKAASGVEKGFRDASNEIAWSAAQTQYSAAELFGAAGPPIQPFMNKEQEQRARMAVLFKKVDPSKLAMLDDLVEKRKNCKDAFGMNKDGFEQMWKSYKKKWGAKAVDEAFTEVQERKHKFYRAKKVALFTAKNSRMLSEVDALMKKHEGKYEELYKSWVSTKKFDAHALAAAHATVMQQLDK